MFIPRSRTRRLVRCGVAAAAVSLSVTFVPSAHAVNRYTILANSPKPAACNNSGTIPPGTWLQNKPCGYWVGTAMAGSSYDVHQTNPSGYHWGRNYGNNNFCAWIPPGALSGPIGTASPSCSDTTKETISHRRTIGYNFNAPPGATDGSPISVNPACGAYYNYFTSSSYNTGYLRDYAGTPSSQVVYRYTTNDSAAIVVRDGALGWVFMSRSCVTSWQNVVFNNDND